MKMLLHETRVSITQTDKSKIFTISQICDTTQNYEATLFLSIDTVWNISNEHKIYINIWQFFSMEELFNTYSNVFFR